MLNQSQLIVDLIQNTDLMCLYISMEQQEITGIKSSFCSIQAEADEAKERSIILPHQAVPLSSNILDIN
jgi:hypothetical protein